MPSAGPVVLPVVMGLLLVAVVPARPPRERPPVAAAPAPEDRLLAELEQSRGSARGRAGRAIGALAPYRHNPRVVRALLDWYWYDAGDHDRSRGRVVYTATALAVQRCPYRDPVRFRPAVASLYQVRLAVLPTLVDEYAADYAAGAGGPDRPESGRMRAVVMILSRDLETARRAVEYASRAAVGGPGGRPARKALMETIMGQFPGYTSNFPGVLLPE